MDENIFSKNLIHRPFPEIIHHRFLFLFRKLHICLLYTSQDTEQMARAAGEALLRLIRKEPIEQKEYVVPVRLEVRSTT